jgi:hypothetical protein
MIGSYQGFSIGAKNTPSPRGLLNMTPSPGTITHNKLGLGLLKSRKEARSEVSVYQSPVAKGRRYVVAWQNLVGLWPIGFADIAKIIKATITEFER